MKHGPPVINPVYEPLPGMGRPYMGPGPYNGTVPSTFNPDQKSVAGYSVSPSKYLFYEDKDNNPVSIGNYAPSVGKLNVYVDAYATGPCILIVIITITGRVLYLQILTNCYAQGLQTQDEHVR